MKISVQLVPEQTGFRKKRNFCFPFPNIKERAEALSSLKCFLNDLDERLSWKMGLSVMLRRYGPVCGVQSLNVFKILIREAQPPPPQKKKKKETVKFGKVFPNVVGGVADSQTRSKPIKTQITPKIAFLTRISPFVFPNLTKTLGWVGGFAHLGKLKKKTFFMAPLPRIRIT